MKLGPEDFEQVRAVFDAARDLSGEARQRCLDEGCGSNAQVRKEVEELLSITESGGHQGLSESAIGAARQTLEDLLPPDQADTEWTPSQIGPYTVVRRIAEGGMGVVYEGEQDSPRRRIALKVIHPMFVTPSRLGRFRQEAELLGRLQHPGIAQIYEAGSYDLGSGTQPYFAMELVEGVTLTEHVTATKLSVAGRLALLANVCDAVQHAHEKGVIHRDLKPDNVLIDGEGQPKVLDFGVARAAEGSTVLTTLVTEEGDLLGTIAYMAPEQLEGRPDLITPRADVYALGAMAFEILAGRLPYELLGLPLAAAIHIVRDQDPSRLGDLRPELRGEVETIVGKALEKDPARRYGSADAFAADLRAYVEHRPIAARPPSRAYRAAKFTRRNRAVVLGAAATMLMLALGLIGTGIQAARAQRSAAVAQQETRRAQLLTAMSTVMSRGGASEARAFARANPAETTPADQRSWEWLYAQSFLKDQPLILAENESPYSAAWSPDGTRVAVAGTDALVIYASSDGRELDRYTPDALEENESLVLSVAWNAAGDRIAMTGLNVALVYDPVAKQALWLRHDVLPGVISWDPEDHGFWTVSFDQGALQFFDADSGAIEQDWGPSASLGIAFAPSGDRYVQPDKDRNLKLFDAQDRERSSTLGTSPDVVTALEWSPNGRYIATAGWDMRLRIWDPLGPRELLANGDNLRVTLDLDWHPSSNLLLSGGQDQAVHLWTVRAEEARLVPLYVFRDHPNEVRVVRWSPTGDRFLSVSARSDVRIWDRTLRRPLRRFVATGQGSEFVNLALSWSPDGRRLLLRANDQTEVWDVHQMQQLRRLECVLHPQFNATGTRVASCGANEIQLINADGTNEPTRVSIPPLGADVAADHRFAMAWHPSKDLLVHASLSGVYALEGGELSRLAPGALGADVACWLPSGDTLLVSAHEGLRVLDLETGKETLVAATEHGILPHAIAVHPSGDLVAIAYETMDLQLYSLRQSRWLGELPASATASLHWSPDGTRLATASDDGTVKLWDAVARELTATFLGEVELAEVRWSPDGSTLAALGRNGQVQLWDASLGLGAHGPRTNSDPE